MKEAYDFINFAKRLYGEPPIPLHRPFFDDLEKANLVSCIDTNFVSSVGVLVEQFEEYVAGYTDTQYAIACVNGTAALHAALNVVGVRLGTQVITQALSFVATSNAIKYCGAEPIFIDVDRDTLGMSPISLLNWLENNAVRKEGVTYNKVNGRVISACVPMHTFGLPARIDKIQQICSSYSIPLIEDAAEALGSAYNGKQLGSFGDLAIFSFNGNKIITTGGGGMIVSNDKEIAQRLKHLTTTAKQPHPYEYFHDIVGYNYRMPNINAAIGLAQMDKIDLFIEEKRKVAAAYAKHFEDNYINFVEPISGATCNNWLNAVIFQNKSQRDNFLNMTNDNHVMTRPIWHLLSDLPMYEECLRDDLLNSKWLVDRVVNLPSSVPNIG